MEMNAAVLSAFAAALATGFLGSLHCISMCGATIASVMQRGQRSKRGDDSRRHPAGSDHRVILIQRTAASVAVISGASASAFTTNNLAPNYAASSDKAVSLVRTSLAFNAGRIISYIIAGALVGGLASGIAMRLVINDITPLRLMLFVFGQCLVIATGLYIAGFTRILTPFERAGQRLWKHLQRWIAPRLKAHFANGPGQPFAFGLLWGWIPCGLVYGTLATAMSSASAERGALIMLGFGLGTLPAMFTASAAAVPLRRLAKMRQARIVAGGIVISLGIIGLSRVTQLSDFAALMRLCLGDA